MIPETRCAVLVKVKGVFFFVPKRDYRVVLSIEEGNAQNEPGRMFGGAAVIMSFILSGQEKGEELWGNELHQSVRS